MDATLALGPQAETISAMKSGAPAPCRPDGSGVSRYPPACARQEQGTEASYAGIRTGFAQELAAAQHLIETLSADNTALRRRLAESRLREAQVQDAAWRDELTGLPNRRLLKDRLRQENAYAMRRKQQVALLFIDLDGFKAINDTFGHAAGDQLLCEVAMRLVACLRASDTACRHGGDEFVVLIPELEGPQALEIATNKIRRCIEKPYLIGGKEMLVGASIGCAVSPADGTICHALIEKADAEMYRAKVQRKLAIDGGEAGIDRGARDGSAHFA